LGEVLWDQQHHLYLHRLCQHLHLLVLLVREHLCRPELGHLVRHDLVVLERLVRLDQEELVRLDPVVQLEGLRVLLCLEVLLGLLYLVVQPEGLRVLLCLEVRLGLLLQVVQLEDLEPVKSKALQLAIQRL